MRNSKLVIATLMLVLTNVFWGVSFPIMKMTNLVMDEVSSIETSRPTSVSPWHFAQSASFLVCVRFSFALALLRILYPRLFTEMTRVDWFWGLATGTMFSAGMVLQNMALNDIPASRSGFLTSLSVVFTPILLLLIQRQVPRWTLVAGVFCALIGTSVLTGIISIDGPGIKVTDSWHSRLSWGDVATTVAALFFAGQIVMVDRASREIETNRITPGMFLATLVIGSLVFLISQFTGGEQGDFLIWGRWLQDARFLGLAFALSVLCTIVAFHLMNTYQPYVSPSEAAVIYSLEPLFATLWAMSLPIWLSPQLGVNYRAERPGMELVVGGLFLFLANILALWPRKN